MKLGVSSCKISPLPVFRAHFPARAALLWWRCICFWQRHVRGVKNVRTHRCRFGPGGPQRRRQQFWRTVPSSLFKSRRIAYCATGDRHLAEDAAQEAFAVACRDLRRLRQADKFAAWLIAICRKTARRISRSKFRHTLSEDMLSAADPNPDDDSSEAVRQSVRRLPAPAREVIVLHYFSGLSHEQISAALGISPQAVHGRLIRARQKIAEDLRRNGLVRRKI